MSAKLAELKKFIVLKGQLYAIQSELRQIRPKVLELLESMPEHRVEVSGKMICLMTKQRTWFDLKKAKEKLGKILKPFFKRKEYEEITILGEVDETENE